MIYRRESGGGAWVVADTLVASDARPQDGFGHDIAVDGATLAVGAPNHRSGRGAVYVFERDPILGSWLERSRIEPDEGGNGSKIGTVVALGDAVIAAGVPDANSVLLFTRMGNSWTKAGSLVGRDTQVGDGFGLSLGLDREHVYVGAPGQNDGAGAVYVFRNAGSTFVEGAKLTSAKHMALGASIEVLADGHLLVSAPGLPLDFTMGDVKIPDSVSSGAILEFGMDEVGNWFQKAEVVGPADLYLRIYGLLPFSASGSRMLVSAPSTSASRGSALVFERNDALDVWEKTGAISGAEGDNHVGLSVELGADIGLMSVGRSAVYVLGMDNETGIIVRGARLVPLPNWEPLVASGPAKCKDGAAGQFDCSNVDLLSFVPVGALGGSEKVTLNDIWGWTDPETGREYALVGRTDGTAFVDVTAPGSPVYVGELSLTEGANPSAWRDIKVYENHAFIVADGAGNHGMQVFDLTQLRNVTDVPATFEEAAIYTGVASSHNIVINEASGFAFAVGSRGGGVTCMGAFHMIDIRDPVRPVFAGCFADGEPGQLRAGTHDAQCVLYHGPDVAYEGREICFGSNGKTLGIADVTDKEHPVALARASYPNVAYAHQGWLTEDHTHFFMNDEMDELAGQFPGTRTLIWDVSDLDDPRLVREWFAKGFAIDHNLYIKENIMYQSNYIGGLRVIDISEVTNPVEIGYFDTVPFGQDFPTFHGSWSNYPFFASGTIVVSSIGEGLFVLKRQRAEF